MPALIEKVGAICKSQRFLKMLALYEKVGALYNET
jgi:hypothetical protein